jgi:hypothetical protein
MTFRNNPVRVIATSQTPSDPVDLWMPVADLSAVGYVDPYSVARDKLDPVKRFRLEGFPGVKSRPRLMVPLDSVKQFLSDQSRRLPYALEFCQWLDAAALPIAQGQVQVHTAFDGDGQEEVDPLAAAYAEIDRLKREKERLEEQNIDLKSRLGAIEYILSDGQKVSIR